MSEINLNGGEISILKTLGLSGTAMSGKQLAERMNEMEAAEFLDTLDGLLTMDYVLSDRVTVRTMDEVKGANFRASPAHARELRDAVYPSRAKAEPRRRRRRA